MSLSGSFVLEKNENLEAFLKALGVSEERINLYVNATPSLDVSLDGTTLKMATTHGAKTFENTITIGKPSPFKLATGTEFQVDLKAPVDNVAKGTFTAAGKSGEISIEFGSGQLVEIFSFGGATTKRTYKKK